MTCRYCGNEMRDDAKFCPHCGAVNGTGPEAPAYPGTGTAYLGPEAPEGGNKKKTGLLIGGAVAAAAVIALLVVVVSGMFSSPKKAVEKAAIKSAAGYVKAEKALGLPDLDKLKEERSYSQLMSVALTGLDTSVFGYDLSPLEGLGLSLIGNVDCGSRVMDMELSAFWDDDALLDIQMAVDDDKMYLASSQLTGGDFYGMNTETLGADLAEMTGDSSVEDVSFNFFDLVDAAAPDGRAEEAARSLLEGGKALWEEAKVKKEGARSLTINGHTVKTSAYQVTFPQEALDDYIDVLVQAMASVNDFSFYEEFYRAFGVPQEDIDEFMSELEEMDLYGSLADSLHDAVEEMGELELEVCLSDGYVSAVFYEGDISGDNLSLALYLGGGEEYVDDLRLEAKLNGQKLTIDSSGDHSAKSGTFTDKTTLRLPLSSATSELSYVPQAQEDNLSWKVSVPGAGSVELSGDVKSGKDSIEVFLDEVSVKLLGLELVTLEAQYDFGPYTGSKVSLDSAKLIPEMEDLELLAAAMKVQSSAQNWVEEMGALFSTRLPEELLDMLM